MIDINNILNKYNLKAKEYQSITNNTYKVKCEENNCYALKKGGLYTEFKYRYLMDQNINNILYPIENINNKVATMYNDNSYILLPFIETNHMKDELKIKHLSDELNVLHINTTFRKELPLNSSKKKLEEIYNYLLYKFNALESFVRSIEEREYDENSILILKEYHKILDAKKVIAKLNKKIIEHIKVRKTVDYSFIHNNPKLNHLLVSKNTDYLISIENSKIGIPILDVVKFYIETEGVKVNRKEIVDEYFKTYDDEFYFDYFCFFVMLYYIKSIVIIDRDYVSSQSIVYAANTLERFINDFNLQQLKL